jgi:hypothetical protein
MIPVNDSGITTGRNIEVLKKPEPFRPLSSISAIIREMIMIAGKNITLNTMVFLKASRK